MTLGVHDDLWALMRTRYAGRTAVTQAVRSELNRLRRSHQTAVAKLAKRAALDTSWQGPGVLLNSDEERTAVESLRGKISAGRPGHPNEHLGEATCILHAIAVAGQIIMEDYDARVWAINLGVTAVVSVHSFLYALFKNGVVSLDEAVTYIDAIHEANRGPKITVEELQAGRHRMGRVGRP